jgi:hypothetical protein
MVTIARHSIQQMFHVLPDESLDQDERGLPIIDQYSFISSRWKLLLQSCMHHRSIHLIF